MRFLQFSEPPPPTTSAQPFPPPPQVPQCVPCLRHPLPPRCFWHLGPKGPWRHCSAAGPPGVLSDLTAEPRENTRGGAGSLLQGPLGREGGEPVGTQVWETLSGPGNFANQILQDFRKSRKLASADFLKIRNFRICKPLEISEIC